MSVCRNERRMLISNVLPHISQLVARTEYVRALLRQVTLNRSVFTNLVKARMRATDTGTNRRCEKFI